MALKVYEFNGGTYQFDDSDVPAGAVEVKAEAPANKSVSAPENKAVGHDASKPAAARRK